MRRGKRQIGIGMTWWVNDVGLTLFCAVLAWPGRTVRGDEGVVDDDGRDPNGGAIRSCSLVSF